MINSVKRTVLTNPDDLYEQQDRPGFIPICQYGSVRPEENEIGAIVKRIGKYRYTRVPGVWEQDCIFLERLFYSPS